MAKHCLLILFALLLSTFSLSAQEPDTSYFSHPEMNEVHDESDSTMMLAKAIDTLATPDKYVKIILFDDHTWDYIELERPDIDTTGLFEDWNIESVHAYRDVKISDLPEEVDLLLVDSIHHFAAPYVGRRSSTFKFRKGRPHNGIDIPLRVGDTIRSPFDGVVRYVGGGKATGGYGNLVVIRHSNGLETYYGHLSQRLVVENDLVAAGDPIGLGGSTGRSTGPHLHMETRYMGKPFDPERVINFDNGTLRDTLLTLKRHYFNVGSHYGMTDAQSKAVTDAVYYKVKKGDTLGKIAKKYGTTVNAICRLNGITPKKVLRIGQRLRVR
ncbi:MAG: peptidoglycan DD-metalloendopeptidase family protein [Bacteroidales bacterium]|nr:peptidoglycan DD-metalloendopeptidase family protein [Bacteroidales bacterium]